MSTTVGRESFEASVIEGKRWLQCRQASFCSLQARSTVLMFSFIFFTRCSFECIF